MTPRRVGLRRGWTTGSCAAAAAKAATACLATGQPGSQVEIGLPAQGKIEIGLPTQDRVRFAVDRCELIQPGVCARAVVIKDAGDDPDVTHKARIVATVSWHIEPGIVVEGGQGVGVVTLPGLGLPVGQAAINPVPRAMIIRSVREALAAADASVREGVSVREPETGPGLRVEISVPGGESLARRTLNARLGILGGISILGTTGIVRPFSTESWRMSVEQAVRVAAETGGEVLVLCTGGRTERAARALLPQSPPQAFVEVGDFTGAALRTASQTGVQRVLFVGMIGKLTKLAAGILMTHANRSRVDGGVLDEVTRAAGGGADLAAGVAVSNTARHGYELWERAGLLAECSAVLCSRVADTLRRFAVSIGGPEDIEVVMVDFSGSRVLARAGGDHAGDHAIATAGDGRSDR